MSGHPCPIEGCDFVATSGPALGGHVAGHRYPHPTVGPPSSPSPVHDVARWMGVCIDDQQLALVRLPDKPPYTLWQRKYDGTLVCLSDNWRAG